MEEMPEISIKWTFQGVFGFFLATEVVRSKSNMLRIGTI